MEKKAPRKIDLKRFKLKTTGKYRVRTWLIMGCLVLALATAVAFLVLLTSVDQRFIRSAERGVKDGWKVRNAEEYLRRKDRSNDPSFIEIEYEAAGKYAGSDFRSKRLEKAAKEYIAALEDCRKVIATTSPDMDFYGFWRKFSEPYGRRISALYTLQNMGKGFDLRDSRYEDEFEELMLEGWALDKTSKIRFKTKTDKKGRRTFSTTIKNDSGYDLAYLDLTVELYDKNDKLLETDSAYAEDIKNGEERKILFYESGKAKAVNYAVTAVNCRRKTDKDEKKESGDKIDTQTTLR